MKGTGSEHAEFTAKTKPPLQSCLIQPSTLLSICGKPKIVFHIVLSDEYIALFRAERGHLPEHLQCTQGFICNLNLDPCGWKTHAAA